MHRKTLHNDDYYVKGMLNPELLKKILELVLHFNPTIRSKSTFNWFDYLPLPHLGNQLTFSHYFVFLTAFLSSTACTSCTASSLSDRFHLFQWVQIKYGWVRKGSV